MDVSYFEQSHITLMYRRYMLILPDSFVRLRWIFHFVKNQPRAIEATSEKVAIRPNGAIL